MKVRSKSAEVDAVQFTGDIAVHAKLCRSPGEGQQAYLSTDYENIPVYVGDWIITHEGEGDVQVIKDSEFVLHYEPAGIER